MKTQKVIPTETYLTIVSQSSNTLHFIANLCAYFNEHEEVEEQAALHFISREIYNYQTYVSDTSSAVVVGGVA